MGEGEGGKIWENGIETCIIYMKRVASPGSMHDTGCVGLVHWDDPEGWYGEGGGRREEGTSGVNIVDKSPHWFCFSPSLGEAPLRGFSLRSMLCILCTQSVLKAPLFKKLFVFLRLRQRFRRLWGQSGELLGPGRHKRRRWQSP